ncbi:hypothetical protein THAOC_11520, partial [Thalassiosira oceanica]
EASLIQRRQWRRQTHIIRAKDSRYRSAVSGNSGHSGLLWGIEEHVKNIEAIHGNSGSVDADAVVHIFPGRSPTPTAKRTAGRLAAPCPKKVRYEARRNFDWKKLPGSGTGLLAEQWGAVVDDEVATGVHGVFPLPMGI